MTMGINVNANAMFWFWSMMSPIISSAVSVCWVSGFEAPRVHCPVVSAPCHCARCQVQCQSNAFLRFLVLAFIYFSPSVVRLSIGRVKNCDRRQADARRCEPTMHERARAMKIFCSFQQSKKNPHQKLAAISSPSNHYS